MEDKNKKVGRTKTDIKEAYKGYVERVQARNETPEVLEKWTRKIKDPKDPSKKITVAGLSGETKAEIFKRLGNARVDKVLKGLKSIKNLSSSQYEYTPEQVEKIEDALMSAVEKTISAFSDIKEDNKIEL